MSFLRQITDKTRSKIVIHKDELTEVNSFQNHPQSNMERISWLIWTVKVNSKSWLEQDSNSHLRVSRPPLY